MFKFYVRISLFCIQDLPDISNLTTVTPSVVKLDVDRLRKDIPKYYPFLQAKSKAIWEEFLVQQLSDLTSESSSTEYQDQFRQLIAAGNKKANPPSCDHEESAIANISSEEEEAVS